VNRAEIGTEAVEADGFFNVAGLVGFALRKVRSISKTSGY
jgi:hypothetical protein